MGYPNLRSRSSAKPQSSVLLRHLDPGHHAADGEQRISAVERNRLAAHDCEGLRELLPRDSSRGAASRTSGYTNNEVAATRSGVRGRSWRKRASEDIPTIVALRSITDEQLVSRSRRDRLDRVEQTPPAGWIALEWRCAPVSGTEHVYLASSSRWRRWPRRAPPWRERPAGAGILPTSTDARPAVADSVPDRRSSSAATLRNVTSVRGRRIVAADSIDATRNIA